ncbi:MAG TPA: LegC family aminotransferase [Terriglobia bacterium]|nr:LegC family aminotransferase [Terriglobia bacterium]
MIPLSAPEIAGNEWKYVKECLDTGWVSSAGPFVTRFETEVSAYVGSTNAIAVANGTVGLHAALRAVGVQPGDEVLVPNLTFVAPVNAIVYCQAHPVLMDVHPHSWHIDIEKVSTFLAKECAPRDEGLFNKKTGRRVCAILPVHILGLACEIEEIVALARRYGLKVVEDAAEALGVRYRGRHVGTFGDMGVLSFNGNKIVTAGGGGMIVSDNDACSDYGRYLTMQAKDDPVEYFHGEIGYNYRLSNIQAAVGVAQLERIAQFIARKRAIAETYRAAFAECGGITPMPNLPDVEPNYWLYTVLLHETTDLSRRQTIIRELNARGICARPLWHTIHDLPPYRTCQAYCIEHSPRLYERGVSLPSSAGLDQAHLMKCIADFKQVING